MPFLKTAIYCHLLPLCSRKTVRLVAICLISCSSRAPRPAFFARRPNRRAMAPAVHRARCGFIPRTARPHSKVARRQRRWHARRTCHLRHLRNEAAGRCDHPFHSRPSVDQGQSLSPAVDFNVASPVSCYMGTCSHRPHRYAANGRGTPFGIVPEFLRQKVLLHNEFGQTV